MVQEAVQNAPVPYANLTPVDDKWNASVLRIATNYIVAWGERQRIQKEPARTFIITNWGGAMDVGESLAEIDAIMGYQS